MTSARCEFLSAEWFRRAAIVAATARLTPESACRVTFGIGDLRCSLVVAHGVVERLCLGSSPDEGVLLTVGLSDAWSVATCARSGNEALAAFKTSTTVAGPNTSTTTPAPMGLVGNPALDAMPVVVDATLTVYHEFADGPFGGVDYTLSFVDGRVVDEHLGPPDETPDVSIAVSYRKMALVRSGLCTILEALEDGGRVEGSVSSLMALAALYEHTAFAAAMRATGVQAMALATVGELAADESFQAGMRSLMSATTPIDGH